MSFNDGQVGNCPNHEGSWPRILTVAISILILALLQIYIFCKQWLKILEIERMFDPWNNFFQLVYYIILVFEVLQGNWLSLVLWFIGVEAQ